MLNAELNVQDMSDYVASLDYTAKKRYVVKLKVDGSELKDQYSIAESQIWKHGQKSILEIFTSTWLTLKAFTLKKTKSL